jgi:hypothetical protein
MSNAAAKAALDAALALLNVGGAGTVEIRTGAPPTNVEDAATGTLLGTLTLSATAFPASADANPGAIATANAITDDSSADASGTAGWFRAKSGGGTGVIQGTCGTASADMILNTAVIVSGLPISVTSWTVTMPET